MNFCNKLECLLDWGWKAYQGQKRQKERKKRERKKGSEEERDKHSSLLQKIVNYAFKKFYNIGLRIQGGFQP